MHETLSFSSPQCSLILTRFQTRVITLEFALLLLESKCHFGSLDCDCPLLVSVEVYATRFDEKLMEKSEKNN